MNGSLPLRGRDSESALIGQLLSAAARGEACPRWRTASRETG